MVSFAPTVKALGISDLGAGTPSLFNATMHPSLIDFRTEVRTDGLDQLQADDARERVAQKTVESLSTGVKENLRKNSDQITTGGSVSASTIKDKTVAAIGNELNLSATQRLGVAEVAWRETSDIKYGPKPSGNNSSQTFKEATPLKVPQSQSESQENLLNTSMFGERKNMVFAQNLKNTAEPLAEGTLKLIAKTTGGEPQKISTRPNELDALRAEVLSGKKSLAFNVKEKDPLAMES